MIKEHISFSIFYSIEKMIDVRNVSLIQIILSFILFLLQHSNIVHLNLLQPFE